MSVLKLKDENGKWVGIPTIKGDKGDAGTYVEGNPNGAATDGDLTKIKIDNKIYSIHDYNDAINGKLDKQTAGTAQAKLYGVLESTQRMYTVQTDAGASTVVMRGTDGGAVFNQGKELKSAVILNTIEPAVIALTSPEATTGTITDEQLSRLRQTSLSSVNTKPGIFMNNEYYEPMDKEYETGILGYTHVGYDDSQFIVKNITITISEKKWVLNQRNLGGTQYKHCIAFNIGVRGYFYFEVVDGQSTQYTSLYNFMTAHPNGKYALNGLFLSNQNSKKYLCVAEYLTTGNNKITMTFSGIPADSLTSPITQFTLDITASVTDTVYELT